MELRVFLDNVVARLISEPAELLWLCNSLQSERTARDFMRFYVRHELADHDTLLGLAESPSTFNALPDDPQWAEVVVLLYGSTKLNETNGRELTIAELAPLGVDVERSVVRSLVGSALDAGVLASRDRDRLLDLFPNDPYFRSKLG